MSRRRRVALPMVTGGVLLVCVAVAMLVGTTRQDQPPRRSVSSAAGTRDVARRTSLPAIGLVSNLSVGTTAQKRRNGRLAASLGAEFIRDDFEWREAQPRRGARWDWTTSDGVVLAAAQAGMRVLPLLDGTPSWAGASSGAMPRDPQTFARYAAAVAARYGTGGSFWRAHPELDGALAPVWFEVYNEPYLGGAGDDVDPEAYARTVSATRSAVRRANAGARLLLAVDLTSIDRDGVHQPWIARLFAAVPDLGEKFDGVAVHPYGGADSPYAPATGDEARYRVARIEQIRASMAEFGAGDKPFWVTETGWTTCRTGADEGCVSEARQSKYLGELFYLLSTRWTWVRAVSVFVVRDYGSPAGSVIGSYGLLRQDDSLKPGAVLFRRFALRAGALHDRQAAAGIPAPLDAP